VLVSGFVTVITVQKCAINALASPTMSKPTRVLSQTTRSNEDSLSSNDFSNLTNSPSPTPELQYTRAGTSEYVHSKCTHQYPCMNNWYTLVGSSCSRSCPSKRISRLYRRKPAPPTAPLELRGVFFLARSICTTNFSHHILVRIK